MGSHECRGACDESVTKEPVRAQRGVSVAVNVNAQNTIVFKNVVVMIVIGDPDVIIVDSDSNIRDVVNSDSEHQVTCVPKCVVVAFICNII